MSNQFIITYTPIFKKSLLNEYYNIDPNLKVIKNITDELLVIETTLSKETFIKKCLLNDLIFTKHLMPVDETITLNTNVLETILNETKKIVSLENDKFSIQCRIKNARRELDYSAKDIEVFLGKYYESLGNEAIFSKNNLLNEEVYIISILIDKNDCYLGFSTSNQNLNFGCDEHRICSNNKVEISRAENKLKEALNKFQITLSGKGYALDLGAAPGGWTKVLADFGYDVTAVDPGALHPDLINNPKITHFKNRIENINTNHEFDIITNDMNIDPNLTADIMNTLANKLKSQGLAIITFKLPNNFESSIAEASKILEKNYKILQIKSLFHNRQEVTVLLKKNQ